MNTSTDALAERNAEHTKIRTLIDQHFSLRIAADAERRMRDHLPECASCKTYYETHLQLSYLDPAAAQPMERLGSALGLRPFWNALPIRKLATGMSLALAAVALLVFLPNARKADPVAMVSPSEPGDGFTARGSSATGTAALAVFEMDGDKPRALENAASFSTKSELVFGYRNPANRTHLLVFGVDSRNRVHWYFPEWTDAEQNPRAVRIEPSGAVHQLPDAISHVLAPGTLRLYGVFTNKVLDVQTVEAALGPEGPDRAKMGLASDDPIWSHALEVKP
ncbi:MAG: hypothetical protein SGI86_21625 [Deltaproteobacteria bacterium]|mgnify:CR=1 FL=1|nr:hypothetical protein [Deltaproteobacteria bacterium]